jgi:predicted permease
VRAVRASLRRLRGFFSGRRTESELAAEIQSHIELHIDDNIRAGMTPDEARRAALVKFGPLEAIKEEYRERAGIPILEILLQDLRYAARRLARQPGFALLVIFTLALGVGANAAMFGLVDTLMFRMPDHVREPGRLVSVQRAENYVRYQELSERVHSVDFAAYTRPRTVSFGSGASALPLRTQCVTPSFFPLLGASAFIGRDFTAADDTLGSERTIVLSHGFWSRQFGADPRAIGATVTLASRPYSVIGVAPKGFKALELQPVDAWILVAVSPEACSFSGTNLLRSERGSWLNTIGRLREGVTLPQAMTELAAVDGGREPMRLSNGRVLETAAKFALLYPSKRLSTLTPDSRLALWLAGGAGVLLLLACANMAGLFSMRAVERRREIAVRLQLGASRRRVFGQLLVEHLLTAGLGGVAAIIVAVWLGTAFRPFFPFGHDADLLDLRMLTVLAVLALAAGVLSGTIPALQASRSMMVDHLKTGRTAAPGRSRFRTVLLIAQVAFALVLVVGAGLFVRSVQNFRRDFAYDLDHVVTAAIDFRRSTSAQPEQIRAVFELLLSRVRALSQVESAALSSGSILGSGGSGRVGFLRRSTAETSPDGHRLTEVTPEYFRTLGLRLTGGRTFNDADRASGRPVIILNEAVAARLFPGENPVGQCVLFPIECAEVIGVSEPFRASVDARSQVDSEVFLLLLERAHSGGVPQILLIRTRTRAVDEASAIAAALQGASPDLPYVSVRPLSELADAQARSWLLGATVFSLFGTLAVILAAIGIYGTLAFSIRQRTVEIGVRMALGALRSDVAGMVLRHGALVVFLGCAVGAAGAFAASRFIGSLLFNVAPGDPGTFAMAAGVLTLAALAGCIIPAARASRIDPAVALRYE